MDQVSEYYLIEVVGFAQVSIIHRGNFEACTQRVQQIVEDCGYFEVSLQGMSPWTKDEVIEVLEKDQCIVLDASSIDNYHFLSLNPVPTPEVS